MSNSVPKLEFYRQQELSVINYTQMLLYQPLPVYALKIFVSPLPRSRAISHFILKLAILQSYHPILNYEENGRIMVLATQSFSSIHQILTLSIPLANSNISAKDSPAAILMLTSSEERRLGSLWKCLKNSHYCVNTINYVNKCCFYKI